MRPNSTIETLRAVVCTLLIACCTAAAAQRQQPLAEDAAPKDSIQKRIVPTNTKDSIQKRASSTMLAVDTLRTLDRPTAIKADSLPTILADSMPMKRRERRDWSTWRPDPQRALWLALVLPGAGQIYNRKYWKLPLVYGGIMGCVYALTWNDMMYKDYSQAYLDIMDDDPNTNSYNKFLHLGMQINSSNEERYKQIFKSRKDKYRRWRDMSFFVMMGVYALSVIDAYVDAELSVFDISNDLSLRVSPTVIPTTGDGRTLAAQSVGLNCSLTF